MIKIRQKLTLIYINDTNKIKAEELEAREKRLAELQAINNKQDSLLNALNNTVKRAL